MSKKKIQRTGKFSQAKVTRGQMTNSKKGIEYERTYQQTTKVERVDKDVTGREGDGANDRNVIETN